MFCFVLFDSRVGSNIFILYLVDGCIRSKKQGAYGKVITHKESRWTQLMRIDEVFAALMYLYVNPMKSNLDSPYIRDRFRAEDLAFCDDILLKVSRSFAAVIRQLPATMLVDVAIFYLVLRALDTIEDDMEAFESNDIKIKHLLSFHNDALENPEWCMDGVGYGDERRLLQEFPKVQRVYAALEPDRQKIIADITRRMAEGMAEFVGKDMKQGTVDITQYNRYCHFVAGLVGEGLSRLFAASGLEDPSLASELHLSDQMGLFLQKTNIIRDYLEDYVDRRAFWPQTVWRKYSESGDLGYFRQQDDPVVRAKSLQCLNEMITDALELVPDCLMYMSKLQCVEIFRFCAIPQVMAIATLEKCYSNLDVFTGVVKIRKGLSCKLLLRTNNLSELHETFNTFARRILNTASNERRKGLVDPSYPRTVSACETILDLTNIRAISQRRARAIRWLICAGIVAAIAPWNYLPLLFPVLIQALLKSFGFNWSNLDLAVIRAALVASASVLYLYGPWNVRSNLKTADILNGRTVV